MAVTISPGDLAVAIRVATDPDAVPTAIATVLGFLQPAAAAMVTGYAPDAPDDIHNAAVIRLAGWLYDADPTDSRIASALQVSGAAPLMSQWRGHRAGAIGSAAANGATPGGGGNVPEGAGLPPLPGAGSFILTVNNGELAWVDFPLPPS